MLKLIALVSLVAHAGWAGSWKTVFEEGWARPKQFPISGYSEFTGAYPQGVRPYETVLDGKATLLRNASFAEFVGRDDSFAIGQYEEMNYIRPGMALLGKTVPVVSIMPLALTRTQDNLGRFHPWTVYGGADIPWEEAFFRAAPTEAWLCELVKKIYGESCAVRIVVRDAALVPEELRPRLTEGDARVLLTFVPEKEWPARYREAYAAGKLHVIPSPETLAYQGSQIPLDELFSEHTAALEKLSPYGLRVLDASKRQSRFSAPVDHRASGINRANGEDLSMIFEAIPKLMELYAKPLARNVQLWGISGPLAGRTILDGPSENRESIARARALVAADAGKSIFRYRNYFPPMDINGWSTMWYRPLVAWTGGIDYGLTGTVRLTRGKATQWFPVRVAPESLEGGEELRKLSDFSRRIGRRVPEDVASALVAEDYRKWKAKHAKAGAPVAEGVTTPAHRPVTFASTVDSSFEKRYWQHLVDLTEGPLVHKNCCDCAATDGDPAGRDEHCRGNDQRATLDYLRAYYAKLGLETHTQKFDWKVDFDIPWWEGLKFPQENLIVVIHGKDGKSHDEAIIMGDHYDTAYQADVYEASGHRHAAKGADDNHSATATLMEAARALKDVPLTRDVWLVHLTGEEFPPDGLGSRALAQALIEGQSLVGGRPNPKIAGIFILDMVAHVTERDKGTRVGEPAVFQIAPGRGERAAGLALTAHAVGRAWNRLRSEEKWDAKHGRTKPWQRTATTGVPDLGRFTPLAGEIRPGWHERSSLYQTDVQIYSDAGFPAVLFMENYDVNRQGYHDSHDTLANIDLDFGRAMASVAIETVAAEAAH